MSRTDITWYCGECGYQRGEQHTCPPDEGETIASLVDALPSSPPSPAVREEAEKLSDLRRRARPDGLFVREPLLGWLLTGLSYLEVAGEKLRPYTAEGLSGAPAPPPAKTERDEEARVERARQPPEPAKPYGDDDLAFFRERARQGLFSLSGPPARLLATIDLREAERDKARALMEQFMDEASTARVNLFQAEQEARQAEAERNALRGAIRRYLAARDRADPAGEREARQALEALL